MKVTGVIPSRYQSGRFPGKPLADICGRPMVWWVYQQAIKTEGLDAVYVATDDERIKKVCDGYEIPVVMTAADNPTHLNRIHEVSRKIDSDLYVVICGDEPLIDSHTIQKVIPAEADASEYVARALMREFTEPTEVVDPGNIKIAANAEGKCLYLSRSPIPYPYKTILYKFRKIVGIECYSKMALEFFVNSPAGELERIEDIAILRFMEGGMGMHFTLVDTEALSVDTEKDLEKVRAVMQMHRGGNGQ